LNGEASVSPMVKSVKVAGFNYLNYESSYNLSITLEPKTQINATVMIQQGTVRVPITINVELLSGNNYSLKGYLE